MSSCFFERRREGTKDGSLRIALVGATIDEALKVMVTGRSGLVAVARTGETVMVNKSERVVTFASGAQAFRYSGACPDKLRGSEHHHAWCDELAKWRCPEETWDNLQLGLRLGAAAQAWGRIASSSRRMRWERWRRAF